MKILNRSELDATLATASDPLGLVLVASGMMSREVPRLLALSLEVAGEVLDIPLDGGSVPLMSGVMEALTTRTFVVPSAPATSVAARRLLGVEPSIVADVETARAVLGIADGSIYEGGLVATGQALQGLMTVQQQVTYLLELQVATWLLESSIDGYNWAGDYVYPTWTSIHPSGSHRIVSRGPSISNVKRIDRVNFRSRPDSRWVGIQWRNMALQMAATLSGDPELDRLAKLEDPYVPLAVLWSVTPERAKEIWYGIVAYGSCTVPLSEKLKEDPTRFVMALQAAAPVWAAWESALYPRHGAIETRYGRVVAVPEASYYKVHGTVLLESIATELKVFLAKLRQETLWRRDGEMAGFHSLIPMYEAVFYQINVHVPIERHVDIVRRMASADGVFSTTLSIGPSWGELYPVDSVYAQVVADLTQPGQVPLACPVCDKRAPDEETLREHMATEHAETPA